MCGRYALAINPDQLAIRFDATPTPEALAMPPRYNIAPTQLVPMVTSERKMELARWGLVPSWSKDMAIGAQLINARAETLSEKPSFRAAFKSRRCLIPADAFYEWQATGAKTKTPMRIALATGEPFAMAGLWEAWKPRGEADAPWLVTCAIITTEPNEMMSAIHNRMPVILDREGEAAWLDKATSPLELTALMQPFTAQPMHAYAVSPRVNNVRNDDAALALAENGAA
jgi:putative SOS response-associated peptidase YedK